MASSHSRSFSNDMLTGSPGRGREEEEGGRDLYMYLTHIMGRTFYIDVFQIERSRIVKAQLTPYLRSNVVGSHIVGQGEPYLFTNECM